jgi:hypothetical protein
MAIKLNKASIRILTRNYVNVTERGSAVIYVVQPKSSRNLNAARKPLVVQLWASRYRELYPL